MGLTQANVQQLKDEILLHELIARAFVAFQVVLISPSRLAFNWSHDSLRL